MIKKAVFGAFLLCLNAVALRAQHNAISPYAVYGYGVRRYDADAVISAMGGVGADFSDGAHINLSNPAVNAQLKQTTYQLGINTDAAIFKTHLDLNTQSVTYVGQAALAVPFGRSALLLGFSPFSAVGYVMRETPQNGTGGFTEHRALGGLNAFLVGYAYQISPHFSLGVHANYLFGNVEKHVISAQQAAQFLVDQRAVRHAQGFYFNGGLLYTGALKRDEKINVGATYALGTPLETRTDRLAYTFQYAGDGTGRQLPRDTIREQQDLAGTMDLPARVSLALGLDKAKRFGYGLQLDFEHFEGFRIDGKKQPNLKNSMRFAAGGYWIPDYDAFRSYASRITYRFGVFYEHTALEIRTQRIKDFGLSLGLALPMGHSEQSRVDLGLTLGRRGTVLQNLIQENYLNLKICFSFNAKWFRKRKYD